MFDKDLLIVSCGRFIKYILINNTMFDGDKLSENVFIDANINFDSSVEISKIWTTVTPYVLQI